ncbi:phosphoadenosine phosphosulfate reductase family protein, partial [Escherichia coli]|nr:phosphoadenosine phosphosulfate reductase family protein [Escherichia coli]
MSDTLLTEKILTGENVLRAAIARIEWIFETFPSVCLSFSGGKDSTVLFHLVAEVARRRKRHFSVLFIDWEAQYRCTIEHIQKMREMYHDGFAPIFPDTCYHLTHYWLAAVDIPVASDNPVHYADA